MIDVVDIDNGIPEIGYVSNRRYWNNGYMTEALGVFKDHLLENYDELYIQAVKENYGSNQVILHNGFTFERMEPNSVIRHGTPADVNVYSYRKGGHDHAEGDRSDQEVQ